MEYIGFRPGRDAQGTPIGCNNLTKRNPTIRCRGCHHRNRRLLRVNLHDILRAHVSISGNQDDRDGGDKPNRRRRQEHERLPVDCIQKLVQVAYAYATPEEQAYYNTAELGDYYSQLPFYLAAAGTAHNVNFGDGIRHGDTSADQIPLQSVYEPADCRILYTPEMAVDVMAIWKAVADSTWGGASKCITGSVAMNTTGGYGKHGRRLKMGMSRRTAGEIEDYPLDLYADLKDIAFSGDAIMLP